eukprot:RCo014416
MQCWGYADGYRRRQQQQTCGCGPRSPSPSSTSSTTATPCQCCRQPGGPCAPSYATQIERQVERVVSASARLEAYHEAMDQVQAQVSTCDDKIANLTQLLKLTQSLGDEREEEARAELRALKGRCQALEQSCGRAA